MGGRGARSKVFRRLPNAANANIPDKKITEYLLKPGAKHYNEFVAVGYSENDPNRLKQDLRSGLLNNQALSFEPNQYGDRSFEVEMTLGITSKAQFITAWRMDHDDTVPRFVTAHHKHTKGGKQK